MGIAGVLTAAAGVAVSGVVAGPPGWGWLTLGLLGALVAVWPAGVLNWRAVPDQGAAGD